jgi:hypothetical protein
VRDGTHKCVEQGEPFGWLDGCERLHPPVWRKVGRLQVATDARTPG